MIESRGLNIDYIENCVKDEDMEFFEGIEFFENKLTIEEIKKLMKLVEKKKCVTLYKSLDDVCEQFLDEAECEPCRRGGLPSDWRWCIDKKLYIKTVVKPNVKRIVYKGVTYYAN